MIKQCALERDLELFEAGDVTEVGKRGLTLRQVHGSIWVYEISLILLSVVAKR